MSEQDGLICAYRLNGDGTGASFDWDALDRETSDVGSPSWIHLHLAGERTISWIRAHSGLPEVAQDALLADETRPRCVSLGDALLVNLRGVNLNPGADPEDMVSVRLHIDAGRIVSVQRRRLMAAQDIRDSLADGHGPESTGDFLVFLTQRLMDRMGPIISDLDDQIDALEDRVLSEAGVALRSTLWQLQRQAISLRRYVAPQREAMARMATERVSWMDALAGQRLREAADRITRYVEDLDSGRERAAIVQDELTTRLTEKMNRNMYLLSVFAGIFLPLTLVTGLLGVNVGGIPGEKWPWAFTAVALGIVGVGFLEYLIIRRLRWL